MILVNRKNTNKIISGIFISILLLLIFMTEVFAGTDNTGMQMATIDCTKLSGLSPEAIYGDDTSFLKRCINAVNNGNGLQSYNLLFDENFSYSYPNLIPTSIGQGDDAELFMYGIYKTSGEIFLRCTTQSATADFIGYYDINDYMPGFTGIYPLSNTFYSFPVFTTTRFNYLVMPGYDRLTKVKSDSGYFNPSTDITTFTFPTVLGSALIAKSADIFYNRLFICNESGYLIYSQAANYENFTASATEGGIIKVPTDFVYNIKATDSGIYIFCSNGIYMLYGDYEPTTWTLKKVYDKKLSSSVLIKNKDNTVYFICNNQLMTISNGTVSRVCEVPFDLFPTYGCIINERFLAYHCKYGIETASYLYLYDVTNNTWSNLMNIICLNSDIFYSIENLTANKLSDFHSLKNATGVVRRCPSNITISSSIRGNNIDKPIQIETNFTSIDGNTSNLKHIRKIEIDVLWNTRGFRSYEADNLVYDVVDWSNASFVYPDTKIAINNTMKISVISNKLNKKIDRTFTDESVLDESNQPSTIRTFTINNKSSEINTAVNSIKFRISLYGDMNIKAIRIYYIPAGNYKNKGKY